MPSKKTKKVKPVIAWAVVRNNVFLDYQNTCLAVYKTRMDSKARAIMSEGKIIKVKISPI